MEISSCFGQRGILHSLFLPIEAHSILEYGRDFQFRPALVLDKALIGAE